MMNVAGINTLALELMWLLVPAGKSCVCAPDKKLDILEI